MGTPRTTTPRTPSVRPPVPHLRDHPDRQAPRSLVAMRNLHRSWSGRSPLRHHTSAQEYSLINTTCPFCPPDSSRIVHSDDITLAVWDAYPVSDGHALVLPRRHFSDWFQANELERSAMLRMVDLVRAEI